MDRTNNLRGNNRQYYHQDEETDKYQLWDD